MRKIVSRRVVPNLLSLVCPQVSRLFRPCNRKVRDETQNLVLFGSNFLVAPLRGTVVRVIEREDIGSWLDGPPTDQAYPGEHAGRPQKGPGSIGRFGRRLIAFVLDWYLCWGILALLGLADQSVLLLVVVWLYQILTVGFMGHTLGHLLLGMQVQTVGGQPAGWLTALIRSTLVMLVIPVFMMDADQRGVHDRVRHTVLVRVR